VDGTWQPLFRGYGAGPLNRIGTLKLAVPSRYSASVVWPMA
jgi:hypothetical protein